MNILDENIRADQRQLLLQLRLHLKQVGQDVARKGLKDDAIIAFLLQCRRPTFFTRDIDFFDRRLCHRRYCLVWLDVVAKETARFVRRFLRHPDFQTQANRMGCVIRVAPDGLAVWRRNIPHVAHVPWDK